MGTERESALYIEFEEERKVLQESYAEREEKLKKAYVALQLAKRKLLNEKNLVQVKLDEISRRYTEKEKQIRFLNTALKLKEQELYKDYIEKEKKYTDYIENLKKEITLLEARLTNSQKELRDTLIKLQDYEDVEEDE
jgi:predicted  nucleic acid-binding Zn-ribbon protein